MPIGYSVWPDGTVVPRRDSSWRKVRPSNREDSINLPVGTILTYKGHDQEAKAIFVDSDGKEGWMELRTLTEFWEYYPQ